MSELTEYAKGKPCLIRVPLICCFDDATTVACHVPLADFHGVALKMLDWFIAFGCATCHAVVDGKDNRVAKAVARQFHLDGMIRTQAYILEYAPHLVLTLVPHLILPPPLEIRR